MRIAKRWNTSARKVLQFTSLEVIKAQLVETLCNLTDLTGEPELFYDSKMFREFHFQPALASNLADIYNFSYFPYFLFCFLLIRHWQKALEDSEPDNLSTCQTLTHGHGQINGETTDQTKVLQPPLLTKYRDLLAQL